MPPIWYLRYYAIYINRKRSFDLQAKKRGLIERLTATASEITYIPERFFTVTIKELSNDNFGVSGKSIDEIKRNYKP